MKLITLTILAALTFGVQGCFLKQSSPEGGAVAPGSDTAFKVSVPMMPTKIKQGEMQPVSVTVDRDKQFRHDVRLDVEMPEGLTVDPAWCWVKSSDRPEVQFVVTAAKTAPITHYDIRIKATPDRGQPTWVTFPVDVVAP